MMENSWLSPNCKNKVCKRERNTWKNTRNTRDCAKDLTWKNDSFAPQLWVLCCPKVETFWTFSHCLIIFIYSLYICVCVWFYFIFTKLCKIKLIGVAMRRRGSGLYNFAKAHKEVRQALQQLWNTQIQNGCKFPSHNATTKYHLNIFEKKRKKAWSLVFNGVKLSICHVRFTRI